MKTFVALCVIALLTGVFVVRQRANEIISPLPIICNGPADQGTYRVVTGFRHNARNDGTLVVESDNGKELNVLVADYDRVQNGYFVTLGKTRDGTVCALTIKPPTPARTAP